MKHPVEYKVVALRECPSDTPIVDTPERAAKYWREHIATDPQYRSEQEQMHVLMLNSRMRIKGHQMVSLGTLNSVDSHPREVFRAAVIAGAYAIIVMHNHPSGDTTPSQADIKVSRDLIRGGQLLKVEVQDHVIMGVATCHKGKDYASLRELGYFYL